MCGDSARRMILLLLAVALLAAGGCASVRVIQPVATQNQRNAEALQKNMTTLLAVTDDTLPALLDVAVVAAYRDTILAIRNQKNRPKAPYTSAGVAAEYKTRADALKAQIDQLNAALRPAQIASLHRQDPLPAAVAFGGMSAESAASIWLGMEKGYEMYDLGTPSDAVFKMHMDLLSGLSYPVTVTTARRDILDAYHELRSLLVQQSQNAHDLAQQLSEASQSQGDPQAFLSGVLGNTDFLTAIAEAVGRRTGSPDRKKEAEALLTSLHSQSASTDLIKEGGK